MTRNRFEQVDGSAYPSGCTANLDLIPETHENQLIQSSYSITDTPGFHISVWCNTGIVPNGDSADCDIVRQCDALLSTFDMISSPMPIFEVEKSTLEHYSMLRRVFILNTSKQLAPDSKVLKSLLPLLKSPLSQAFLKELVSADTIAGQDFVETLLHSAICAKDSSIVAPLLRLGCDPNQQVLDSGEKKSLLRLAAEMGELSVVKILADAGANVNGIAPEGHGVVSPLITAVDGNFLNVVEYLLRCGSRIDRMDSLKHCPCFALPTAARQGNLEMTRLLFTSHTHVQPPKWTLDTALSELIMSYSVRSDQDGRNEILEMLLAGGANPECIVYRQKVARRNPDGWFDDDSDNDTDDSDDDFNELWNIRSWTALEFSAKRGHLDFVATLLENGAQVSENAVLAAIGSRHADLACFLLGKKEYGSLNHSRGYEMLRDAIDHEDAERNTDLVRALLKAGANPNKFLREDWDHESGRDSDEESDSDSVVAAILDSKYGSSEASPLEIAAERGHAELLNLLLSAGAWVIPPEHPHFKFETKRRTVLDRGAKSGKVEILERLLKAGADIPSSRAALVHVIEKLQNPEMVWRLIQGGVDVNGFTVDTITPPLQAAVRMRNLAITQMLLDAGANKNLVKPSTNDGLLCRALCDAIKAQDHDLINILLQSGADVNDPRAERDKATALETAVASEDLNLVFKLLQLGSDPNDSRALLAAAIPNRPAAFLEALLHSSVSSARSPYYGCAALQIAIRTPDCAKVQRLLQAGVRCDLPASESGCSFRTKPGKLFDIYTGLSALGSALKFDQGQCGPILRIIFAAGMDPNALADYHRQYTGLQFAVAENICDLAQFMIAGGADVNFNCPKSHPRTGFGLGPNAPICIAVAGQNIRMVKLLLSKHAHVDAKDLLGTSLLTMAASRGNIGLIETLLDAGAAVNANGSDCMCPALEAATEHGSAEIVRRLLRAGAKASGTGSKGYSSALCYAVSKGYLQTVRILLEAGADANVSADCDEIDDGCDDGCDDWDEDEICRNSISAIQFCAARGSVHMAALLVRWGADVNTRASLGENFNLKTLRRMRRDGKWLPPLSPLEEAAARGHLDMLQLLLHSGAITHGNGVRQYRRALGYARRKCNDAAVKLLKKHHAAESALRQPDGFCGTSGLQANSEAFPWGWEMNSERS